MERHPLAEARGESVQAPTTNLPSNDPWRDEESPQTPETPRLVLECEKPSSAKGNAGKHREKDSRSRWREKPDATTKTATHLHHGPTRTRKPSTPDVDTQAWQTGKTPARPPDAVFIMHLLPGSVEDRMPLAGRAPGEYASVASPGPVGESHATRAPRAAPGWREESPVPASNEWSQS